jgi:hypothetical protein
MTVTGLPYLVPMSPFTPTQARVETELFARDGSRPEFDPHLAQHLMSELEAALGPMVADYQPDDPLVLSKRSIAQLHSCEGLLIAERETGFEWSAAAARGTVAHKAVELSVTLRDDPAPLDLVDIAIERLIEGDDKGISSWLLDAPAAEVAELRGAASDWVIKFQDTFPPLRRAWRPRLESSLRVELCGRRVQLRGRVDLALGQARGCQARVLIVDFKSGRALPVYADDLRFYALLETIRVGVPPFRLATFSLESGTWVAEDVDLPLLEATIRRTIDAAAKLVGLEAGRAPVLHAGASCRWCPAAKDCSAARAQDEEERAVADR